MTNTGGNERETGGADAQLPGVTIAIPTLNAADDLRECLRAIATQDYPRERLEVLVLDGGSGDETVRVAEAHGCRVVSTSGSGFAGSADARMGLAVEMARHEIVAFVMADNWMPQAGWLREMVQPLVADASVAGAFTLRYAHRPDAAVIERYFALLGVGDPVAYYLNRRDRMSWAEEEPRYEGVVEDRGRYYRVTFATEGLPPLGCNGTLVRRSLLAQAGLPPERFTHSDAAAVLARAGQRTYAAVKIDIVHRYRGGFVAELRKRMRFFHTYREFEREYRLFDVGSKRDRRKLMAYVVYSLTLAKPAWDSWVGYRKRRDVAWFVHAPYCLAITVAYGANVAGRAWRERRQAGARQGSVGAP